MHVFCTLITALALLATAVRADETFSAEALMRHVRHLASPELRGRRAGTPSERVAAEYIARELEARGVKPLSSGERYQRFRIRGDVAESLNVLGWIAPPGTDAAKAEVVVLGAHCIAPGSTSGRSTTTP